MSIFDPTTFLDTTISESNEKRPPLPALNPEDPLGQYMALIGEVVPKSGEKDGKPWLRMDVPLVIQVPASVQAQGLPPQLTLRDSVFIDMTPDGKGIDMGKGRNNRQRIYREAAGMNTAGQAWSWRMMQGKMVKVSVKHEMYNDAIQERAGNVFPA